MKIKAPELSDASAWLNVASPLSLESLRGKLVLLDFWTFCCSDCMHILPYLRELEERYAQELVVIGVHSAKFDNEKDRENIKNAVLRYNITHPVACDSRFALWEKYWIREWPTLVLIDPEGFIVKKVACSERPFGQFEAPIEELIREHEEKGTLCRSSAPVAPESSELSDRYLRYPGKVAASETQGLLFIADSGHNRILIADKDGEIKNVIGSGLAGEADGDYESCQFNSPQGLCLVEERMLYVADTENHFIRAIDLENRIVTTVAGNGKQLLYAGGVTAGPARQLALSSPWDLCSYEDRLFIAMAGAHQIWAYNLQDGTMEVFAGSGRESLKDSERLTAELSQPSGITCGEERIYFVDSETSSLRFMELSGKQTVKTIVGSGLFDFGDCDGRGAEVKLQHPLGVLYFQGKVFIADSYNHKIKLIDPEVSSVKTVAGNGKPGYADGKGGALWEPGGLALLSDGIYIADTNNHAIRRLDLESGELETLHLKFSASKVLPNLSLIRLSEQVLNADGSGEVYLNMALPSGFHLNDEMPVFLEIHQKKGLLKFAASLEKAICKLPASLSFEIGPLCGKDDLIIDLIIYYCGRDSACHVKSYSFTIPLTVKKGSPGQNRIEIFETV